MKSKKIDEIIQSLLHGIDMNKIEQFESMIYKDEPILKKASQVQNYTPREIYQLKKQFSSPLYLHQSVEYNFYHQGKQMENYEDDYTFNGNFFRYFPTYDAMVTEQLRGYFSWRTKVRKNQIEKTSLSFVYIYLYELLNQIGVSSPIDGFNQLKHFISVYRDIDDGICRYTTQWLIDYAVYNQLDVHVLDDVYDFTFDNHLSQLNDYENYSEEQLFTAIEHLSTYPLSKITLYPQYHRDIISLTVKIFVKLSNDYNKKNKTSFFEKCMGKPKKSKVRLFSNAIFYFKPNITFKTYKISPFYQYQWATDHFEKIAYENKKSKFLGSICLVIDHALQKRLLQKTVFSTISLPKNMTNTIEKTVIEYFILKEQREKKKIKIDVSQLTNIRANAQKTFAKIVTEEEQKFEEEIPIKKEMAIETYPFSLTKNEYILLQKVLNNEDYHVYLKENKLMDTIVVDGINEKLYDYFADIVVLLQQHKIEIVQDYLNELKGVLKHENT